MEKRIKAGFLAILALALAVSFAGTLYRAVFSSYDSLFYENRSAAPLPKADFASLWDGAYMTDLDEYLSDQYIARTRLIKAQTFLDLLLQRPVVNDIVVGEDLLLPFHGYSYYGAQDFTTEAAETAGELARLEEVVEANGGELFYLCIPEQSSYFRDEYPESMDDHAETLDAMSAAFTGAMASAGLRLIDAGEVYAAVAGAGRSLGYVNAPSLFQQVTSLCCDMTADLSVYERNAKLLVTSLREMGYHVVEPGGAFYLFPRSLEPDDLAFSERAKQFDLLLVPGSGFGAPGHVRIAYCVQTEMIERALPKFKALAESYRK